MRSSTAAAHEMEPSHKRCLRSVPGIARPLRLCRLARRKNADRLRDFLEEGLMIS